MKTRAERIAAQHRAFEVLWLALRTDTELRAEAEQAKAGRQSAITRDEEAIKRASVSGALKPAEAITLKRRALGEDV